MEERNGDVEGEVRAAEAALAPYNVVATFPDMEAARAAVSALERHGIDGANISLLGRRAEQAAEEADTRGRDAAAAGHVARRVAAGAAAGSAAGGVTGFLAGLAAFAIPGVGPVVGAGVLAATIGGAVGGAAVGGVVGAESAMDMSGAWELTYESVRAGRVLVGVHGDDEDVVDRGEEALTGHRPLSLDRFDAAGRRVARG
jgi:hypothetical protein